MLTKREQEILGWIQGNPSITQKEIAERAHISRSSVAVHISSLIKKGAILGRQYVLSETPYAVVVGGANIDIAGKPTDPLIARDSNPGTVRQSLGGAGRNIAHNMALLGCRVKLISAFGDDAHAEELMEGCRGAGIDVRSSLVIPGAATSTYLVIMDDTGTMQLAIADMSIYDQLVPACLESRLDIIEHAAACVIDTNLPAESLAWLTEHVSVPLFCDPVSTTKAEKLEGLQGQLHTIKPNRLEAEMLSHTPIHDEASLKLAAQRLLDMGLHQVFISLDAHGLYCANHTHHVLLPALRSPVVNTTGAGDCMMAAITWAYLQGSNLVEQGRAGLGAASICVESAATINQNLSPATLRARIGLDSEEGTHA